MARIGGDADWIARYLAGLDCTFEVLDSDRLRAELGRWAVAWSASIAEIGAGAVEVVGEHR